MRTELSRPRMINRDGFVMPVVILAIVVLGTMAVAALTTASDEVRSSRAIRESITALYAAEAGANLLLATVVDSAFLRLTVLDTSAANMSAGDSVDFGWSTLPGGATYRAVFHRYGPVAYALDVTGRDVGFRPAEQNISYALASAPTPFTLGGAVSGGAPPLTGDAYLTNSTVSGRDSIPTQWDAAGCPTEADVPGITWYEDGNVNISSGTVEGTPPIQEDNTIEPFTWGDINYGDLVDSATITFGGDTDITVGPVVASGNCSASNSNWGDPLDPSSPCAYRLPIIHVAGKLTLYGYGQGILLVDGDIDIKENVEFYGLIAGQGDINVLSGARVFGGIVGADDVDVTDADGVFYSSCAVSRAWSAVPYRLIQSLDTRPWSATLR